MDRRQLELGMPDFWHISKWAATVAILCWLAVISASAAGHREVASAFLVGFAVSSITGGLCALIGGTVRVVQWLQSDR